MVNIACRDGFDQYASLTDGSIGAANQWLTTFDYNDWIMTTGRFGTGKAVYQNGQNGHSQLIKGFDAGITEGVIHMALNASVVRPTAATIFHLIDSMGENQMGISYSPDGSFNIYRQATLLAASTPGIWIPGSWGHLGVSFQHADAGAAVSIFVNGEATPRFTATGLDTKHSGAAVSGIKLGANSNGQGIGLFDDILVTDDKDDFLGDVRVQLFPVANDGSHLDFTPSAGSDHYAVVDGLVADSTDYLSGTTVGHYDEFLPEDMTEFPRTIWEANVIMNARKLDAATREMYMAIDSNGSVANGMSQGLPLTQGFMRQTHKLDPDGSVPWTRAKVNALKLRPTISV